MRFACLVSVVAVGLGLGCAGGGGDGGGGNGGGGSTRAPSTLAPALGALCDLVDRCPNFHPLATRSRSECIDVLYWVLTCRLDEQNDELVGVRRVDLNITREQSDACAAVFDDLSCDDLNGSINTSLGSEGAACLPLFAAFDDDDDQDSDPSASGCLYTGQCPAGSYCPTASFDDAMNAPACRACRGPLQRGEACERYNRTVPCDEDLLCVDDGSGTRSGVCGDPLPNGGTCDNDTQCAGGFCDNDTQECSAGRADDARCADDHWCQSGYCHFYAQHDGRCARDGKIGDACNAPDDCLSPLACIDDECAPQRELGATCAADEQCVIGVCDMQDQRCGIRTGAACDQEPYIGLCRSGWCDNETYICRAKVATGEDCSFSQVCEIGWCDGQDQRCGIAAGHNCRYMTQYCREGTCDRDTGLCTVALQNGTACTVDAECASGFCDRDSMLCATDARPFADGETCTDNSDCVSQTCSNTCYTQCGDSDECDTGEYCNWESQRCQPLLENGSSCEGDEDCASAFCNSDDRCVTKPAIGDACSGFTDCYPLGYCSGEFCIARKRPGQSCDRQDSCLEPYVCLGGTCELPSLRCEPAPLGESCAYFRFCADGAYCDPSTISCVPQHSVGDDCARDEECRANLYCNFNSVGGPKCATASALNEACGDDQPCARDALCVKGMCSTIVSCETSADCGDGTYCEEGLCMPQGALGDRCINSADDMCGAGLFCDIDCEARVGEGESCASYMPCLEDLRCDSDTSTCQSKFAMGDACDSDDDCPTELQCDDSDRTCQPRNDFGEGCSYDDQCASGICLQDYCSATRTCATPRL